MMYHERTVYASVSVVETFETFEFTKWRSWNCELFPCLEESCVNVKVGGEFELIIHGMHESAGNNGPSLWLVVDKE